MKEQTPNLDVYRSAEIVSNYTRESGLQPAERTIFNELSAELPAMRLLDLGIGGGRTTAELASKVREYTGVDYSPEMIRVCEQKFGGANGRITFSVCDARDLSRFQDASFDTVLFSYNGMDCLPHEDRLKILAEILRVLRPDGWFVFSSHNLLHFPRFFRFPWVTSLARMRRRIKKRRKLLQHHPDYREIARQPHAFVYDGTFDCSVRHYYITPENQVRQLREAGFREVRLFAEDGSEVAVSAPRLDRNTWIYYLCRR